MSGLDHLRLKASGRLREQAALEGKGPNGGRDHLDLPKRNTAEAPLGPLCPGAGSSLGRFSSSRGAITYHLFFQKVPGLPERSLRLVNTTGVSYQRMQTPPAPGPSPWPLQASLSSPARGLPLHPPPVFAPVILAPEVHPSSLPTQPHAEHLQNGPSWAARSTRTFPSCCLHSPIQVIWINLLAPKLLC